MPDDTNPELNDDGTPKEVVVVDEKADTFPRAYVEELRTEAASHRTAAKEAKDALLPLQERVFSLLVASRNKLADPSDLAFDPELLDEEKLDAAITELLAKKPHLAKRVVKDDIGQGEGAPDAGFSLAGALAARA